jgi:hypothetical protein
MADCDRSHGAEAGRWPRPAGGCEDRDPGRGISEGSGGLAEDAVRLLGFGSIGAISIGSTVVLSMLVLGGSARAQGSGHEHHGNPNNTCPLMAGMHEMHVAAYHATTGAFDELCGEIPATGKVTITVDAVSAEIRDMTTEITVVKGDGTAPEPVTLAHLPPARYPSGVATFMVDLDSPGQYALLVTLREGGMEMSATHVMTIASPLEKWLYVPVGAAVLAGAAAVYVLVQRRKKPVPKRG